MPSPMPSPGGGWLFQALVWRSMDLGVSTTRPHRHKADVMRAQRSIKQNAPGLIRLIVLGETL
jgi:hypothetical protein